ncbi:MAG: sulfotransferase family protein [Actinomycetes bacterium]
MTVTTTVTSARRSAPGRFATEVVRHGVRAVGAVTAARRPGPDLLVVGTKRGGTTSLWRYLGQHPGVLPLFPAAEHLKGLYYFDVHYDRGERWYRSHFASDTARRRHQRELGYAPIAAEASPYYLFHPLAPARARATVPDARIVVLLRDPVERAFSHWKERRRHTETLTFGEAVAAESLRIRGEEMRLRTDPSAVSFAHRHQSYLAQGRYSSMLERWRSAFPAEQIDVVVSEEFFADPQRTVDQLTGALGLPRHPLGSVEAFNAAPSPDMDPEVRAMLRRHFAPEVDRLEYLLGRELPWPRS